jgi:hypothetical protein
MKQFRAQRRKSLQVPSRFISREAITGDMASNWRQFNNVHAKVSDGARLIPPILSIFKRLARRARPNKRAVPTVAKVTMSIGPSARRVAGEALRPM